MSASNRAVYICPPGPPDLVDPKPDCAKRELHTPAPSGYVAWHEWAASMAHKGNRQSRCPGCDLYVIWAGGRP